MGMKMMLLTARMWKSAVVEIAAIQKI